MLIFVSQQMEMSKDELTQADKAIGDGDHGIGMARGFAAVQTQLQAETYPTLDALFQAVGKTLMMSIGGAAGVVFGTWFRGGAKHLGGALTFDPRHLSILLVDGLQAVKERGKAKLGDKTMVDALEPAADESRRVFSASLDEALSAVAEAARQGMNATQNMVATIGKAKTLGKRSLGHVDPGALTTYLIFKFMLDYVMQRTSQH